MPSRASLQNTLPFIPDEAGCRLMAALRCSSWLRPYRRLAHCKNPQSENETQYKRAPFGVGFECLRLNTYKKERPLC
jgi:hypothetical protein